MEWGPVSTNLGTEMHSLLVDLFPICRSITGDGVRQTLRKLQEQIPLQINEIPSGTKVFDWEVPEEWNIRRAFVENASGERVIDMQRHNLHVVNYSCAYEGKLSLEELKPHLHSLPNQPTCIPYRTSYYNRTWGFCLEQNAFDQLEQGEYRVVIDAGHSSDGSMSMGELYLPGRSLDEVLISCHTCHPSLANDNLSAIVVATELAKYIASTTRRYSYRFLFVPGTIGPIAWLSLNPLARQRTIAGLVLALLGDGSNLTYKQTRHGKHRIDQIVEYTLRESGRDFSILPYDPFGYNERQFNSPGLQMPVGRLSRAVEAGYPEYHTSADNPSLVRADSLEDSLQSLIEIVETFEAEKTFRNQAANCEPQLGRRGLYPIQSKEGDSKQIQKAMMWNLGLTDGKTGLSEIANQSGLALHSHETAANLLSEHGLFQRDEANEDLLSKDWIARHGQPSKESVELSRRAHALIPGGAHTYAKGDDQFPINAPKFFTRGLGCHVVDGDGNRFIEYGMGLRAVGLGHAFPRVVSAVTEQIQLGCNFSRPASIELETAEKLLRILPAADMVKFTKNGSDATTAAIRLARACTGRNRVLVCKDQPFFAVDDWFIGTTEMNAGIPQEAFSSIVRFPYDDIEALETLFEAHSGEFAALIMEAATYQEPSKGYLHRVQELCRKHGTLFILDEMITGFRWNAGGAQAEYGLEPDLSTFGKAIGNGFAIAALAGKREHMELGGLDHDGERVFLLSYTHGAETHSLAAVQATLRTYLEEPVIETIYRRGHQLKEGLSSAAKELGVADYFCPLGRGCNLIYETKDAEGNRSQGFRTLLLQELIKRGIFAPSLVICYSHGEAEIEATIDAFHESLKVYALALEDGYEKYLDGRPSKPVFRSHN